MFGTNSPNTLSHVSNVTHLTTFETTNAGHTAEYKLDKSYPYIVLYAVYKTNDWSSVVEITT